MSLLLHILAQFLFRLSFGIALSMAITPHRWVASGFYRVHLWVLLGINTLAALVSFSHMTAGGGTWIFSLAVAAAIICYVGAVCWLYESPKPGMASIWLVAGLGCICTLLSSYGSLPEGEATLLTLALHAADSITSGLLLGFTTTAMLLGHWYLNAPGMRLEPLYRLVAAMSISTLLRAAVVGGGLALTFATLPELLPSPWFVVLQWSAGILGTLVVAWMTWQTLKIPNTQSATGILYVGVIVVYLGELTALLLSAGKPYPL